MFQANGVGAGGGNGEFSPEHYGKKIKGEVNQWTITKIINRAQLTPVKKVYAYNKMACINSKPALQAGNENLEEYSARLQLHYSFCNPKKIIETIEKQAQSREAFDLVHNKEYRGLFVIDSVEKIKTTQIKDVVLYAEIVFNLLEFPFDEEYKEQLNEVPELGNLAQYGENSNRVLDFAKKVKNSVVENLQDTVMNAPLSDNLGDRAREIFESVKSGVMADIGRGDVSGIYGSLDNILNNLSQGGIADINYSDLEVLKESVSSLGDIVLNAGFRG